MRPRSVLLLAAAALLIGVLVMVKRSLGEADAPPVATAPPGPPAAAPTPSEPASGSPAPAPASPVAPAGFPAPVTRSSALPPETPSLPAVVAEYVPQKKLPPIASKATLREQEAAVTPKLAECAAHHGAKLTGSATLTFVLAHKGTEAVIETTGVDYDGTTLDSEPLLECLRETARDMTFQPVADSSAIYVTRKVELDHGAVVDHKFLDFSRVR